MRKPKPIGPLSSLTPGQKQILRQLYDDLSYEQIRARIALPAPDGFAIDVSVWQLRRYFYRLSADNSPAAPAALSGDHPRPTISEIIDQASLGQAHFTPAALHLLEKRAFELALAGAEPREISTLLGIVFKSRDTSVRERMAEVQNQKLALREKPVRSP